MKQKNRCMVTTRDQGSGATTKVTDHDYEKHLYTKLSMMNKNTAH